MVQEDQDMFRSWVFPTLFGLCRKTMVDADLIVPTGEFCHHEFEGDVSATFEWNRQRPSAPRRLIVAANHNDLRSFSSKEVAREPDSGMGTISELMKYPVPLMIEVSDVYWVIPSKSISIRTLQTRASEVKVANREGFYLDLGVVSGHEKWACVEIQSRWLADLSTADLRTRVLRVAECSHSG